jgi:hypothetical protein
MDCELDNSSRGEFICYASTTKVYDDFLAACHQNKVTVGSALLAAQCLSFTSCMFKRQNDVPDDVYIVSNFPVNYRIRASKQLDIPWECVNLGDGILALGCNIKRNTKFWDLARQIRANFLDVMSDKKKFHAFNALSFTEILESDTITRVKKITKDDGICHTSISNMLK